MPHDTPTPERSPTIGLVEKPAIEVGFIPLTDCAPIVIAHERGIFARHGLDVTLHREAAWSSIRDKVAYGVLDAAHMLAPMPLAATLGIGGVMRPMVTSITLDLNGNAITVSQSLYQRMVEADPDAMTARPMTARALRRVIQKDQFAGRAPLTFGVVFPTSTHNYQLRYWLAAAGIDPDYDLNIVVVPPPQMVERLERGQIDGYCVGEPWNALAAMRGIGRTLITSYEVWNNNPEKVLGVSAAWAEANPLTHRALVRALLEAAIWLDEPANREEASVILAQPQYVGAPVEAIRLSMTGTFRGDATEPGRPMSDFNVFHRYAANFPWRSQALWFLTQMLRWGQITRPITLRDVAESVYRPNVYRAAARELGVAYPLTDDKTEGEHSQPWILSDASQSIAMGPDQFIDGGVFDPGQALEYLEGQAIRRVVVPFEELMPLNA